MGAPHVLRNAPGVALVGGGFIGPVHAEALRRLGIPLVGLLGSSPDRARGLADRLGIARVYRDLDDLLADGRVGAVHVASPNAAHFDQATRVLESGRHIVCEKPLAVTPEETRALRDLAATRPAQAAAVNYNVRFYPICQEMRARVARGDLGRIFHVGGGYEQDWLLWPEDYNWRVEPDGGTDLRAMADIGTHWMDLAQFVVGEKITRVCADLATVHPVRHRPTGRPETFTDPRASDVPREPVAIGTDDLGSVLFRMGDAARGSFRVSQVSAGRKNRITLVVDGSEGSMAWDSQDPNVLWHGHRDRPNQVLERDPALLAPEVRPFAHYPGGHAEGFPDSFLQLFRTVYEWVDAGGAGDPLFPGFADGHREVRLCEAIAGSNRDQAWRAVEAD